MKRPEAVVFDMDGIIFDSEACVIETWKIIADKYGIEDIEAACRACLGLNNVASEQVMYERYGKDFPYKEYTEERRAIYHEKYDGGRLPMKPGVNELLEYLKNQGIKIALASSTRSQTVISELTDAGIIGYFDKVVCGDMVKNSKPDPEIFAKACELLGVKPENAIAIEDSFNGIRSAYAAGMNVIMVPDLMEPDDEMREKTVCIQKSLFEVKELLQKL